MAYYQQVLQLGTYNNAAGGSGVSAETISVVATDGINSSAAAQTTINTLSAPALLLINPTANFSTTFSDAAVVAITGTGHASITDAEASELVSLTASLASVHTGDVLSDSVAGTRITSSYNVGTGVLTLSGSDTLAHYQ